MAGARVKRHCRWCGILPVLEQSGQHIHIHFVPSSSFLPGFKEEFRPCTGSQQLDDESICVYTKHPSPSFIRFSFFFFKAFVYFWWLKSQNSRKSRLTIWFCLRAITVSIRRGTFDFIGRQTYESSHPFSRAFFVCCSCLLFFVFIWLCFLFFSFILFNKKKKNPLGDSRLWALWEKIDTHSE